MSTIEPYDVTVVGAGLAGALVASILAEEGLQVVVLEATDVLGGTIRRQPGLAMLPAPRALHAGGRAARRRDGAHTLGAHLREPGSSRDPARTVWSASSQGGQLAPGQRRPAVGPSSVTR